MSLNKNSSRIGKAVSGASWLTMASSGEYLAALAALVVLARLLSPTEFGIASLALSFLTFAKLFSEIAMAPALIRRKEIGKAHVNVALWSVLLLGVIAGGVLAFFASVIARFFNAPELAQMLWVIALLVPVNAVMSIGNALLSRQGAFRFIALSTAPGLLIGYCATSIVLAWLGFGAWSLVIGILVQNTVTALLVMIAARHRPTLTWSTAAFRDLFHFSVGQTLARILNYGATHGDNFVVARLLGFEALGFYGRAYKLMSLPVEIISTTSFRVIFPLMSAVQDQPERVLRAYQLGVGMLVTGLIPLSVLFIFSARPLVLLVLGPKWLDVVLPMQILFLSMTFRATYRHINLPMTIKGESYKLALFNLFYAIWVIGGAIVAALSIGTITAVAVAVSLALLCHYVLCAGWANRLLSLSWLEFFRMHRPGLAMGAAMVAGLYPTQYLPWMGARALLDILTFLATGGVLVLACVYSFPRIFLGRDNLGAYSKAANRLPFLGGSVSAWMDSVNANSVRA